MRLALCLLCLLLARLSSFALEGTRIVEFQANNQDTIKDEDGDRSDWIELYNPEATAANLAGISLTDDPLVPQKWIFPAGISLPSGGLLVVWASGKDRTNPAANLHTNFKLKSEAGGYLALVGADGLVKLSEFSNLPIQLPGRSWGFPVTTTALVTDKVMIPGAACRWMAPSAEIPNWNTLNFDDQTWNAASTGIGYDRSSTSSVNFLPLIGAGGNTELEMFSVRSSVYVRIPFTITNASAVQSLQLRMKFDDGFAAYLNGVRLNPPDAASTNCPEALAFNSVATAVRSDLDAVFFNNYDLSSQRSALVNGTNVLAIQVLNQTPSSTDLLLMPELDAITVTQTPGATGYLATSTPGILNVVPTVQGFLDAPDFSIKRGLYTSNQTLVLTTNSLEPGTEIRYTTDSSPPTFTTGIVYTNPIVIATTTVVRAGTFRAGWNASTVKTHTYVFPSQVINQPAFPAGFPSNWGNAYDFNLGTLTGSTVVADYRMDPGVALLPRYANLMLPALTSTLPIVSISTSTPELFAPSTGIYSNGRLDYVEIPASMEYFNPLDATGTEKWQEDIGLRIHGGDALVEHPKKPFRIYFRKAYGADRLRYPLFPGSTVQTFDKLQLRPGGHDGWAVPFGSDPESLAAHATYIRDRFMRQTELDMGRLSAHGRFVHLYLNGLYWGFYDIHEVISREFFADHLGGKQEDFDVVEHTNISNPLFDVLDGSGASMDALLALVRPPTSAANPATYAAIQQYLPLDEFIDYLTAQMWAGQNDWMGPVFRGVPGVNLTDATRFFNKNWEAGRRSRGTLPTDGFRWQVWDDEICMGSSLNTQTFTMRVSDFNHTLIGVPATEYAHLSGVPGPPAEIYHALRKYSPAFRRRWADRLQHNFFNNGPMTTARNQARLLGLRNELDLPIVAESARWGDVNSGLSRAFPPIVITFMRDSHWRPEMDWMRATFIATRNQTLLTQFAAIGMWNNVAPPVFTPDGGTVPSAYALPITNPNSGGTVYYTLDGSDPADTPAPAELELIGPNTPCVFKIPSANYPGNSWKDPAAPADIATWISGQAAIGFDANPTFLPHIVTTVTGMRTVRASCYQRIPFNVTASQKSTMSSLILNLKYDDGAYVFLNGVQIAKLNATPTTPVFTTGASNSHLDSLAVVYQSIELTSFIPNLVAGSNLLAIQGLNITAADDDFLCSPQLLCTSASETSPTSSAAAYATPVTLAARGTVKARVLLNGQWSPLTEAQFIVGVPASAANLAISEFCYNPAPPTDQEISAGYTSAQMFEFIELMNVSSSTVELAGLTFTNGIAFNFVRSRSLQQLLPGQRLILASNYGAFQMRYPGVGVAGTFANDSNLSNGGERLRLTAADGGMIFDFTYNDRSPWPIEADGQGYSLVLINPLTHPDPALPKNWRISSQPNGNPGASDADTFAAWTARNSITGNPGDDPDRNGLASIAEYALGLSPPIALPEIADLLRLSLEETSITGITETYLVIHYREAANADDVKAVPEFSTDLTSWNPLNEEFTPPIRDSDGSLTKTVRSTFPISAHQKAYVRLRIVPRVANTGTSN